MKILQRTVFILFLFCFYSSFAQEGNEFFVKLDPFSGQFTKISFLPGVKWINTGNPGSVIDPEKHRVYFHGADETMREFIYGVDINSGNLVSSANYPTTKAVVGGILGIKYDRKYKRFIAFSGSSLFGIDMETGKLSKIADLNSSVNLQYSRDYDIDEDGHLIALDQDGKKFWLLNTLDGSEIAFNTVNLNGPQKVFMDKKSSAIILLSNIDTCMGAFKFKSNSNDCSLLCTAPLIQIGSYSTYDYKGSILYIETQFDYEKFMVIDIANQKLLSNIPFPYMLSNDDNILCPIYDTSSSQLYALHWETDIHNEGQDWLKVYPNPTASKISIESAHPIQGVCIYTMLGQEILNDGFEDSGFKTYDLENLSEGEYLVVVRSNYQMLTQKILVKK